MWSIVVVVVFPLLESFGEEVGVVDDLAFEESVELLGVDPMGPFHFAIEPGCSGPDLDVPYALVEQMPVEGLPELLPVVGLHLLDLERELREHVVDELDRGPLIVAWVGPQWADPDSGAVVDGGVLVVALLAGQADSFAGCRVLTDSLNQTPTLTSRRSRSQRSARTEPHPRSCRVGFCLSSEMTSTLEGRRRLIRLCWFDFEEVDSCGNEPVEHPLRDIEVVGGCAVLPA